MENAKNDVPGPPLATGSLYTSSLSHLPAPFPGKDPAVSHGAGSRNSHHAEVCGIRTSDPVKDGQFTGFNLMAT